MKNTKRNLIGYESLIEQWFKERGIDQADGRKQIKKLLEEVSELNDAYIAKDETELKDAIGDVFVVLVGFSLQMDLPLVECVEYAYEQIKDRKGKVVGGEFIKDE